MEAKRPDAGKSSRRREQARRAAILFLLACGVHTVQAQLAITEVMSQAATNRGPQLVTPKSDFWELTNFGTNGIALDGYSYSDRDSDPASRVPDPFAGCFIAPGESIIFFRNDTITNRQDFLNWWGVQNFSPQIQVRKCPKRPGFDADLDAVQLFDPNGELVDRVDFGRALRGHTFSYDAQTGEFGTYSTLGVAGAFKAVLADDVGTPGFTTGPVPISISQQPASVVEDAGADVEFSVHARGLPRPSYQWLFKGVPIPGANQSSLVISGVQPQNAGDYTAQLNNGLMSVLSVPASLAVNTNPSPATIINVLSDVTVFEGQTAIFVVKAKGFPPPTFQWRRNNVNIPGATNRTLIVENAAPSLSGSLYTVTVQNAYNTTNVSARLFVTLPPRLAITEVMASVAGGTTSGHTDWFELTSFDTNAVNLFGYRFSDRYSFELSYRITNSLIIEPGESIIFVERLTPDQFIHWWGADLLPPGLKITTYNGLGLSSDGDVINFWNGAETNVYLPAISAGFFSSLQGYSLQFVAPDYFFVEDSVAGRDGAFRALDGGDIGSPGYINNPRPRFVSIGQAPSGLSLRCRVTEGKQYVLQTKAHLGDPYWTNLNTYSATNFVITLLRPFSEADEGFFQLEEMP